MFQMWDYSDREREREEICQEASTDPDKLTGASFKDQIRAD